MPRDRDEKVVRILRIDRDLRDLLAVAQAEMRPGFAGIGRFVNAVADRKIRAMQTFAAADIDDVRDSKPRPQARRRKPVG